MPSREPYTTPCNDPIPTPSTEPSTTLTEPTSQAFTLKQLKQRDDWPDWQQSRFKMFDQYKTQGMFSEPMPHPLNANAIRMLWTFQLKMDGTKKSRMVAHMNARVRNTITLGHTYANSLETTSERLFWAIAAQEGLVVIGADVSNAFAEAPPPADPLYLFIDEAYKEWWTEHLKLPPIPNHCKVVRVHNAIQGHPESPRLWEKHIHHILQQEKMKPATHERCLYVGQTPGTQILFLRQVDDFAAAATTEELATNLFQKINSCLRINLKILGRVDRFNGMDIHQTRDYIKITCERYLHKMLKAHNWLESSTHPERPTPLPSDNHFIQSLENAVRPNTTVEKDQLRSKMGFHYRQVIGEVLYPMTKCRPDVAFHITKLSQYMDNPAEEHYLTLRQLCKYLASTLTDGIYYWRLRPRPDLPAASHPTTLVDTYSMEVNPVEADHALYRYVDADWASDSTHRRSVTGIIIMYAGGVVGYRTRFQDTIAHSSTEAEFTAACDAGKLILYFRSLLGHNSL